MNLQQTWRDHKGVVVGWLFMLWAALSSGITFISADADQKPDRLLWLTYALTGLHLIAILIIAALPLSTRFSWQALKNVVPVLRHRWVYSLLLILFALTELYSEPYFWLVPLMTLVARVLLVYIAFYLYDRRDQFIFQRIVMVGVWWLWLLMVHQVFKTVAISSLILPPVWLNEGVEVLRWGSLQGLILILPLLLLMPGVKKAADIGLGLGLSIPNWGYLCLFATTLVSWLVYQISREGTIDQAFMLPLLLLLSSGLAIGLLLIRFQVLVTNFLKLQTVSASTTLQFVIVLLLCAIPWIATNPQGRALWTETAYPNVALYNRSIVMYPFDRLLIPVLVFLFGLLIFDAKIRQRFFQTATTIISKWGGRWWLFLILWMLISILWADSSPVALFFVCRMSSVLALALLLAYLVQDGWGRLLALTFSSSAAFQSLIAIGQVLNKGSLGLTWMGESQRDPANPYGFGYEAFRGSGLSGHPNSFGAFLLVALFITLILFRLGDNHRWMVRFAALNTILIILGLLVCASRTAIVAGAIGGLPILLFLRPIIATRRALAAVVILGIMGLGGAFIFAGETLDRVVYLFENPTGQFTRLTFGFEDTLVVIRESPLLGVGTNNLALELGKRQTDPNVPFYLAHNSYLIIWAESGVLGLIFFALACLAVVVRAFAPRNNAIAFTLACGLLTVWIILALDVHITSPRFQVHLFWLLGLWWGFRLQPNDSSALESPPPT